MLHHFFVLFLLSFIPFSLAIQLPYELFAEIALRLSLPALVDLPIVFLPPYVVLQHTIKYFDINQPPENLRNVFVRFLDRSDVTHPDNRITLPILTMTQLKNFASAIPHSALTQRRKDHNLYRCFLIQDENVYQLVVLLVSRFWLKDWLKANLELKPPHKALHDSVKLSERVQIKTRDSIAHVLEPIRDWIMASRDMFKPASKPVHVTTLRIPYDGLRVYYSLVTKARVFFGAMPWLLSFVTLDDGLEKRQLIEELHSEGLLLTSIFQNLEHGNRVKGGFDKDRKGLGDFLKTLKLIAKWLGVETQWYDEVA